MGGDMDNEGSEFEYTFKFVHITKHFGNWNLGKLFQEIKSVKIGISGLTAHGLNPRALWREISSIPILIESLEAGQKWNSN